MKHLKKGMLFAMLALVLGLVAVSAVQSPGPAEAEEGPAQALAAKGSVTVDPPSIDFGQIQAGEQLTDGREQTITITNNSGGDISLGRIQAFGDFFTTDVANENQLAIKAGESKEIHLKITDTSKLAPGSYTPGVSYFWSHDGTREHVSCALSLKVNPRNLTIASFEQVNKPYGKEVSPSSVVAKVDGDSGTYTMADFGLTSDGLKGDVAAGEHTYSVTKGAGGHLTADNLGSLPQLTVNVEKATPVFDRVEVEGTLKAGQRLADAKIKSDYIIWNANAYPKMRVYGTFEWVDQNKVLKNGDNGTTAEVRFIPDESNNYDVVTGPVRLNVQYDPSTNRQQPTLRFETNLNTIWYDGKDHPVTVTTNSGSPITYSYTYEGQPFSGTPKDAGRYKVTASVDANGTYTSGSISADFTIKQRQVNVVVTGISKQYGEKVDLTRLVYNVEKASSSSSNRGVLDGDQLNIAFHSLGEPETASPNTYPITNSASNKNYDVNVQGNVVVTKAVPTYEGDLPTFRAKANTQLKDIDISGALSGFVNPKNGESVTGRATWNLPNTSVGAGDHTYTATFTPSNSTNYTTVTNINLHVNGGDKAAVPITVDPNSTTWSYDGNAHGIKVTSISGARVEVTYDIAGDGHFVANQPTDAGHYTYKVKADMDDNHATYADNEITGKLIINPVSPTVTVTSKRTGAGAALADYQLSATATGVGSTSVSGTVHWVDGDDTPVVAGKQYGWEFTSSDKNYTDWSGTNTPNPTVDAPKVDLTQLRALVSQAEQLRLDVTGSLDGSDVPSNKQWVPKDVDEDLLAAIVHAQRHLDDASVTEEQVQHSITPLEVAINSFKNSMKPGRLVAGGGGGASGGGGGGTILPPVEDKQQSTVTLTPSSVSVKPGDGPVTVQVGGDGDGEIIAVGQNDKIAFVEVKGHTLVVTGLSEGRVEVRVVRAATKTHEEAHSTLVVNVGEGAADFNPEEPQPEASMPTTTYRLLNPNNSEHLYTTDVNEYRTLVASGWQDEGTAKLPKSSSTPVYRLYNRWSYEHHYTTDVNEYNSLGAAGWDKEGVKYYSDDAKGIPVYRLWAGYEGTGTHHYTQNEHEKSVLMGNGWRDEGIAWYYML